MKALFKVWFSLGLVCSLLAGVVIAEGSKIPPPKGEQCVEPTEEMRRNHFEYILHQRDATVIDGIRTEKHSLVGCIDCHITPNEQGQYARYGEEEHFCASCHIYTSVSIDCFACHADRPEQAIRESIKNISAQSPTTINPELGQAYRTISGELLRSIDLSQH